MTIGQFHYSLSVRNAGDNGEVSTATVSTQINPMFSREDLGAAISDRIRELENL